MMKTMDLTIRTQGRTEHFEINQIGNPKPSAEAAAAGRLYTVQDGDNMWNIWKGQARDNGISWSDFRSANEHIFTQAHKGNGIWAGDQVVIPRGDQRESRCTDRETLRNAAELDRTSAKTERETYLNPATGKLANFDVNFLEVSRKPDAYAGTTEHVEVKDYTGRTIEDDATLKGAGLDAGSVTLAEAKGNLGDSRDLGVDGRAFVEASAELQANYAQSDKVVAGRLGAFAGVEAGVEGNVGFRYFGFGVRGSKVAGYGATAEGVVSNDGDRISSAFAVKGALGLGAGAGAQVWVDYGQIKEDFNAAKNWVGETASSIGNGISGFFSSIDWRKN